MNQGNPSRGFTLIEIIVFMGVFSGMALVFLTILVVVSRIQVRESASAEVNQQSNYLLRTIENSVQSSSLIELAADAATSTLKLRMSSSSVDPTYIYLSSGRVYIKEGDAGTPVVVSSDRVVVGTLDFTKRTNAGAKDAVGVSLVVAYNTSNIQQAFTQAFATGIRRVSAAVFDSNIVPNTSNTYKLGAAQGDWQSINSTIYFSGANVGIGTSIPGQKLEIDGGLRLNPSTSKPTCDSSQRGTVFFTPSGGSSDDTLEVCMRNASSSYLWKRVN